MNEFLLIQSLLFGCALQLDNSYIEIGLGYHPVIDQPEVALDNVLAQWEIGYETENFKYSYQHTSGLQTTEEGFGLNMIVVKWKLK